MLKRSLTLVETLIALALVLAMAALAVPSILNLLDERAFEAVADETSEQLIRARAHAQATGTPVEVTYSAEKSQVQARVFASNPQPSKSGEAAEAMPVEEPWAKRPVGRGVRFTARPPAAAESSPLPSAPPVLGPGDYETWEDFGKGQDVRLAVFMPDGTALTADRVWLNDKKGRIGVFTINPWSGLPLFERLADLSANALDAERAKK